MPSPQQPDRLVLASTSPRRSQLLREAGYRFKVTQPPLEEPDEPHPHVDPAQHAESLAWFKAASVGDEHPDDVILAGDTISVMDGEIYGKPADAADARRILRKLSGTSHRVITGIAIFNPATDRRTMGHSISTIHMRPLSDEMIESYLKTGEWQGKAGAYGIQDHGDAFVERYEGSFTNIVGMPMELVREMLSQW